MATFTYTAYVYQFLSSENFRIQYCTCSTLANPFNRHVLLAWVQGADISSGVIVCNRYRMVGSVL